VNAADSAADADVVAATVNYTVDTGEKLVNETFGPGNIHRRASGAYDARQVQIRNARLEPALSLDAHGFVLVRHPTAVRDFFDGDEVRTVYYAEIDRLVRQQSGAARVHIFDHTLRSGDEAEREQKLIREPVLYAHNDYTDWSAPQRVRDMLPDEADSLLAKRFAIIQVWRPIVLPVVRDPLALVDARTVSREDLLVAERRYPDRVGQTYRIAFNARHRWFYFPRMTRDEAVMFKVFDSETDGRARYTPHTAFDDPSTPADAAPRQSIEVRCLAFFN
jgi:hypothetical protein